MRITELVKTYRLLSDPDAPPWNVKFVGAVSILALVALGVGGIYWATAVDPASTAPAALAAGEPGDADVRVDYVGLPPSSPTADPALVESAMASWRAAHPGATVLSQEPVRALDGSVAGYTVRYLP